MSQENISNTVHSTRPDAPTYPAVEFAGGYVGGVFLILGAVVTVIALTVPTLLGLPADFGSSLERFFGWVGVVVQIVLAFGLMLQSPTCRWIIFLMAAVGTAIQGNCIFPAP